MHCRIHVHLDIRSHSILVSPSVSTSNANIITITVHRQAILLLFVESRTKFLFDVERVLDSTTVLVLDTTPILLLQ